VTGEEGSASLVEMAGEEACTQSGCRSAAGLGCEYVDGRGHRCRTAWCPEHRLVMDGRVYCRRHAGVVSALPGGHAGHAGPLPDLETRAPSLVSWVAREVDADVRRLLLAAPHHDGVHLVTDPVYQVFVGSDRRRAWERAWKLVDRTGRSLRVALLVEEGANAEVAVRVNSATVGRLAPPWIVQRLHGPLPPPEVDTQRRNDFNRVMLGMISRGLAREGYAAPAAPGADDGVEAPPRRP
jgi:hypothetical protein